MSGELRTVRRQRKAAISRLLGSLRRRIGEKDPARVQAKLDQLRDSFDQLELVHDEYQETLTVETEIEESEKWFEEVLDTYIQGVEAANTWLSSVQPQKTLDASAAISNQPGAFKSDPDPKLIVTGASKSELSSMLNMPRIELDRFYGNPVEFHSFMSSFDEMVHDEVEDGKVRLTRLLQYTGGDAKIAIKNCQLVGGQKGYKKARAILHNRYGNDHLVAQRIITELKTGDKVTKGHKMQQLADEMDTALETLMKLGKLTELDTQENIKDILKRFPVYVKDKWYNKALKLKREKDRYPTFTEFVAYVNVMASDSCDSVYGVGDNPTASKVTTHNSVTGAADGSGVSIHNLSVGSAPKRDSRVCVVCNGQHRLLSCSKFKAMQPKDRQGVVVKNKLCYVCLIPGHRSFECKSQYVCTAQGCGKKQSVYIHIPVVASSNSGNANGSATSNANDSTRLGVNNANFNASGTCVYLPIVPILVNGKHRVNALLDSGSTNTFVSEALAVKLSLPGSQMKYHMSTLSGSADTNAKVVNINVASISDGDQLTLRNVLVVPSIPANCPSQNIDIGKHSYLSDLPLHQDDSPVEVLIGMDNAHLLMPLEVRCDESATTNKPYATRSYFGWSLNGPVGGASQIVNSNFVKIEQSIENLWKIDNCEHETTFSMDDHRVLELWDSEISFDDGHYTLPIPWKAGEPQMPNNMICAKYRLQSLIKKLNKNPGMMEKYDENVQKMLTEGYAERVPDENLSRADGAVWYLPHHAVISESKPGKIRQVFDCAAKHHGISLNSQCYQGPDLNNKLIDVLLRFRLYEYAIMADIQAMYLQVKIPVRDRDVLRFLWLDGQEVVEYRMTSHLFGGVWCASSSTYALRRTVEDFQPSDVIVDTIMKAFYVDDLLRSNKSRTEAREVIHGTTDTLDKGGFHLTKFMVNDSELLQEIPIEERAGEVKEIIPEMSSKALGIKWEVSEDAFLYVYRHESRGSKVTRRSILSLVSTIYDPLGLIAPIVMLGRRLFQESTRLKLDWDVQVPKCLSDQWYDWLMSLDGIEHLRFKRCVIPADFIDGVAQLHVFCDASQSGYGACAYLRITNASGGNHVSLLASKGRLSPLKALTIPRLELQGAVIAVRLERLIRRALDVHLIPSMFWSDSQIVLAYIRNDSKRFMVFVANRISEIRETCSPEQWNYVKSQENPADVLSRGCTVGNLPEIWLEGPEFLSRYKSTWRVTQSPDSNVLDHDPEVQRSVPACHTQALLVGGSRRHPIDVLAEHYSSFYRLKKAICWLLRLRSYLVRGGVMNGEITVTEMRMSEKLIVNHVQGEVYGQEIQSLKQSGLVSRSSPLRKLAPVLQGDLIVVGGRLKHAAVSHMARYPAILPGNHRVAYLIASDYHGSAHLGTEWTLSRLRSRFWVTHARNLIKQVKRMCVTCKRLYAAPMTQKMADLPPERCSPDSPPFTYVGVDIFGPFLVKQGRSEVKRYGCVYACMTTRAIHLEKLNSLETDTFINGFIRFVARRGYPLKVWSDNGTNLVGAQAELRRSLQQLDRGKVVRAARRYEVEWVFNPPLASHHGGTWERMIRTVRKVLVALLGLNTRMNDDVMHTVLCEVENIVNGRPITKSSDDVTDDAALSPNHLLILRDNTSLPWGVFDIGDTYRKHWRHAQQVVSQFWKRWSREYLQELQRRSKWLKPEHNLKVGDLVLIVDENIARGQWPLGLVSEIKMGRDDLVRSARVKTKVTTLVRPITKLVLLEGKDSV